MNKKFITRQKEEKRKQLFNDNIRLAYYVGNKYAKKWGNNDPQDIMQDALNGLWKGCLSIDMERDIKPATYLTRCIMNEIQQELRANYKKELDTSTETEIYNSNKGGTLVLGDCLEEEKKTEQLIEERWEIETVNKGIDLLPEKQRYVVTEVLKGKTQKEIAEDYGCNRSYISKLYNRGIEEIKYMIKKQMI